MLNPLSYLSPNSCQVENNVWYSTYSICFTCVRNGFFSRKSSVALSGFLMRSFFLAWNLRYGFSFYCQNLCRRLIIKLFTFLWQQGRISEAETSIKRLYGKERVAEVMGDLEASAQGSSEPDAGWLDLFSSRYWKGISLIDKYWR